MKKKVALTAAAVALVGTLAVGGTLAWFTDTETATNVVTMGEVDIRLSEDGGKDGIIGNNGLEYDNVMPGDEFQKTVTIENLEQAAWVKATISVTGFENVNTQNSEKIEFFKYNKDENGEIIIGDDGKPSVTKVDVTWVGNTANGVVGPWKMEAYDAKDYILFDYIKVPESWGNEFTNASFNIAVSVEAVQFENNEDATNAFKDFNGTVPNLKGATDNTDDATGKYRSATGSQAEKDIVE
ncbi:MAG: SipW-dependent-type signal peptide-containing protein [Clostridiaceae bacterium]|nr:SipW-dependent-type signal peptide-containing protein [Clostridiaceae bacterium]